MIKKSLLVVVILILGVQIASANHTRMATLMAGDFIDDIVFVDLYPHRLLDYQNSLFLDIATDSRDFGIMGTPNDKYGVLGFWQNPLAENGFNIGYAISLYKFDLGFSFSPNKDNLRLGFGVARDLFDQRIEVSFLTIDGIVEDQHSFRARYSRRMGDFNITPRYALEYVSDPTDFKKHKIGIMFQRMILNEGFVYAGVEYDFTRGDIEIDSTHIHGGVELKLNRYLVLRCGVAEHFEDSFENGTWYIEPGIGLRIRDFSIDFHLNEERLFDKEQTFFQSFGLDFYFGRF
jgi:hypothetical protein